MKNAYKKVLVWFLTVILIMCMVPVASFKVSATNNFVINGVDIGYSSGSYFTKNGKSCKDNDNYNSAGQLCERCHKRGKGYDCTRTTDASCNCMRYWPTGLASTCQVDLKASQCFGFVRYCQWKAFGVFDSNNPSYFTDISGTIYTNNCTPEKLKSVYMDCAPATHVRMANSSNAFHSIAIIETNSNGLVFIDCNSDNACKVLAHNMTWEEFSSYVKGYSGITYSNAYNKKLSGNTSSCSCKESYAGTYTTYNVSSTLNIRSTHSGAIVGSIPAGATFTVSKAGDSWAHISYNGINGCVSTSYIKKTSGSSNWISSVLDKVSDIANGFVNLIKESFSNDTVSNNTGYVEHTTSDEGIQFLKAREGCPTQNGRAIAYKDSVGVWTIGYGHTGGVYSGMSISMAEAEQYFRADLVKFENCINSYLKKHNTYVTQYQFDALVSFTYNVGEGWITDTSYAPATYKFFQTNNHTYEEVMDRFSYWLNPPELKGRRIMEAKLYVYGSYDGVSQSITASSPNNGNTGSNNQYSLGNYKIKANGGLRVRNGAGTGYSIVGSLANGSTTTITEVSGNWGRCPTGWICLDYANWVGTPEPVINVPAAPSLNLSSAANIPTGTAVTVTWNAASDADCYDIYLKDSNGTIYQQSIGNTGRTTAFTINDAGRYNVTAVSRNKKYTSNVSNTITVTAHAPSTVSFIDWNGTVISKQTVAYGSSATLPSNPSRYGWTFKKWDGSYNNVTTNRSVYANYERNVYTVTFLDETGALLGNKQKIQFEGSATAPSYTPPEGYEFLGWDKAFNYIESNLTVSPVVKWANEDLPVTILSATTATRESTGYTIIASLRNNPNKTTNGRVIVALKTKEGKLLSMTESAAFYLAKSAEKQIEVFMPYDRAAALADIYVVETFSTAIPISAVLSKEINQGTAWTNWSTTPNPNDAYQGESRTEYRYRTKSTTTSSNSSLSGWTKYNTTSTWSAYGSWSGWTDSYIAETDSRDVETRTVVASHNYKTVYHYYRYTNSKGNSGYHTQTSSYPYWEEVYLDSPLTESSFEGGYKYWYNGSNYKTMWACGDNGSQVIASTNYKTQYRYRDRSLNYTYYYYKWNDWSSWSTTAIAATDSRQVEKRTTYRYLANDPSLVADNSGVLRTISGEVDSSLAGEQAILFIYKVDEASDFTNEYVGQTIIQNDGSYSFTFKLREEPSVKTGDYTVTLGIEGSSAAIFLDPIIAPKPQYTVVYQDYDGTIIDTQVVTEGENTVVPSTVPSRDGYEFICWNHTGTNIKDDLTISPVYKIKTYSVVFVDWTKENVVVETYEHGQPLVPPEIESTDDSFAVGWDKIIDDTTVVTDNMVVTAKYTKKTYTVTFLDESGNILMEETVEYGDKASAPTELDNPNAKLFDWLSNGNMDYVTDNMIVTPVYTFNETVNTPTANIDSGEFAESQVISLHCDTENAVIYYSLNGEDPLINGMEYTEPFTISQSSELRFIACAFEENNSKEERVLVAINNSDVTEQMHVVTISSNLNDVVDSIFVKDGETIEISEEALKVEGYDYGYAIATYGEVSDEWNVLTGGITESMHISLIWIPKMYTVTVMGYDDEVISIDEYEYLAEITLPECPDVEGYVFAGFDCEDVTVKSDMTIFAKYIPEDEYIEVSLDKSKLKLLTGTSTSLVATLKSDSNTDYTLLWSSSNSNIVEVNDNGDVSAVGAGTAYVYVMCVESNSLACCEINVLPNIDDEITISSKSGIGIDSQNQIRGIRANTTIELAKTYFENKDLVFVDITGYVLNDSDLIGTGTEIRLMNGNDVVDEKTVVVTGDMNGDGKINNRDASMIVRYLVDKEVASLPQLTAIDVNGDGYVNNRDASMVSRYLVGKETIS